MSAHIFRSLMSEIVALCIPYSDAKSLPCSPFASRALISKTFSGVKTEDGFVRFAFSKSFAEGQPCLP